MARSIGGGPDASGGRNEEEYYAGNGELLMSEEPQRKRKKGGRAAIIVVVVAVLAVAGVFAFLYLDNRTISAADEDAILDNGTIYQGVSILGVDLSGMTLDEARPLVEQQARQLVESKQASYVVEGNAYELDSAALGASVDIEGPLGQAVMYGREGGFFERREAIDAAEQQGHVIDVPVSYDEQSIRNAVNGNSEISDVEPQDATVEMNEVSDEANKITDMEIAFVDEVKGRGVDREKLAADIYENVSNENFEPVEGVVTELEPNITRADLDGLYTERGVFSTKYASSAEGRRYNIWKMSDIINGVKIEPGEQWSINEEAGPRTYALGWKGAPGISDGEYKEEAGGGICQVSSTLYNAVIRAEVEIVDRQHHSWPLDYVAGGLDATISTGAPDFVIRNNYDVPIYIIARCDGEDARTVEVAIYGPPYEDGLTRDFSSELIDTFGGGGPITVPDPSLPAGQTSQIIGAHQGKKFRVWKHWLDASGNEVRKEEYSIETYQYKPAKVRVGTGAAAGGESTWVQPENW